MRNIPKFQCYFDYSNSNYGINSLMFTDSKGNDFYFSYTTLIAFKKVGCDIVCLKNQWSTTTGKHLNRIQPDHKERVDKEKFDKLYNFYFDNVKEGN